MEKVYIDEYDPEENWNYEHGYDKVEKGNHRDKRKINRFIKNEGFYDHDVRDLLKLYDWNDLLVRPRGYWSDSIAGYLPFNDYIFSDGKSLLLNDASWKVPNYLDDYIVPGKTLDEVVVTPQNNEYIDWLKQSYPDLYDAISRYAAADPFFTRDGSLSRPWPFILPTQHNHPKEYALQNTVGLQLRLINLAALLKMSDTPTIINNLPDENSLEMLRKRNADLPVANFHPGDNLMHLFYKEDAPTTEEGDKDFLNQYALMDELSHSYLYLDHNGLENFINQVSKRVLNSAHDDVDASYKLNYNTESEAHSVYLPALVDFYARNANEHPSPAYIKNWVDNYIRAHRATLNVKSIK